MQRKSITLILILVLICVLMTGCKSDSKNINSQNTNLSYIESIKGLGEYMDYFAEMQLQKTVDIKIADVIDSNHIYNTFIAPFKYYESISGWEMGGTSTILSYILPDDYIIAIDEELGESNTFRVPQESIEIGDYIAYIYTSSSSKLTSRETKEGIICVEKGTEQSENPHVYIWTIDRISGISRPDIIIPSDEKVYTEYIEIGGRKE